jgi:TonB family protein
LEVSVAADGSVANVTVLRTTPPFTDALVSAVRGWRFKPAERLVPSRTAGAPPAWQPVAAKVLVAEVVTAPALIGPTLGELARDVAHESDDTPFPLSMPGPRFPPSARDEGMVLVRAVVDVDGRVTDARALRSAGALDSSALESARAWSFRPARVDGFSVPGVAILIFGFRQPVLGR